MEKPHCLPISVNMAWNTCTSMYQTPCLYITVVYLTDFILYEVTALFIIIVIYYWWKRRHLIIISIDIKIYKVENWKVINIKCGKCERREIDRKIILIYIFISIKLVQIYDDIFRCKITNKCFKGVVSFYYTHQITLTCFGS
jgi:hypothetical protein